MHLVAISDAERAANLDVPYAGTVHNGIDVSAYKFRAEKERRLVYIGRANPDKGPTEAITIARRAGLPLLMLLKRGEPPERAYFEREVEPMLGSDIELLRERDARREGRPARPGVRAWCSRSAGPSRSAS